MSIRQRLEDARTLSAAGSQDGALIQVLIAAAATSRKRYARGKYSDGDSFKNFIYDEMGVITGGPKYDVAFPFQGEKTPLEDILYVHLRNQLVHEGEMPETIVFTEPAFKDGVIHHTLHLGSPLGFPAGWIEHLATAVWLAPENDELWQDEAVKRQKAREHYGDLLWDGSYCRRPKPARKRKVGTA
ncbi:MAG: hypothetical protein WD738_01025 [Pirellulales bacterium]